MKFFSDHDVYGQTVKFLTACGHQVTRAYDVGLAQARDAELLEYAFVQDMIFITRDKDFGALVFQSHIRCGGVVFLRIEPHAMAEVHEQLRRALQELDGQTLRRSFVVIEASHYRVRQLP